MTKAAKRKRGRPPKGDEALLEPVTIRLTKDIVNKLNERRAARLDHPDKSAIVRELLAEALK